MSPADHERFERLIAAHYDGLKAEVLTSVGVKLTRVALRPDPADLDAAYNAAWHGLYEEFWRYSEDNLAGWLTTIAYRRVIDEHRRPDVKYRVPGAAAEAIDELGVVHDVDEQIAGREKYHQWLMSLRLQLSAREQQAISLCVLHEQSRDEASAIMGVDVKRLDKIMRKANKKIAGLLQAINDGAWCGEQRSLIKAYALGLHEHGGERHTLAMAHLMQCSACAAYVRSLRGLTIVVPAPALLGSALATGGGVLGGLTGLFKGCTAGGAAGGSLLGAKSAVLCASVVCAAGGVIVVESLPDGQSKAPAKSAKVAANPAASRPATPNAAISTSTAPKKPRAAKRSSSSRDSSSVAKRRRALNPRSLGAQQVAELGIEPNATSTAPPRRSTVIPKPVAPSEFDIEGP